MSVATEIQRLQTAKADLKTAIEGKGITVPSSTTLDGYATLVGQISSGGGGTLVSIIVSQSVYRGTAWYLDENNNISSKGVGTPGPYGDIIIQSWAKSLLTVLYDTPFEPGSSYTLPNCTLITTINLGTRATYRYCAIFQVNDI